MPPKNRENTAENTRNEGCFEDSFPYLHPIVEKLFFKDLFIGKMLTSPFVHWSKVSEIKTGTTSRPENSTQRIELFASARRCLLLGVVLLFASAIFRASW
jgi:hypothetical protein